MKENAMKIVTFRHILAVFFCFASLSSYAGGSAEASAQAVAHSMEAIGYTVEGGLKLASGAAAIPLKAAGEIGKVSGEIGDELLKEAETPPVDPFPVTDEVITVGPKPADQLDNRN